MTPATRSTARRWTLAVALAVAVASLPALVAAWPVRASGSPPAALLTRAIRAAALPYSGLVEARGSLEIPDLPRSGDTGRLLGTTNRLRVWWADGALWRVDLLSAVGETDAYRRDITTTSWDSARNRVTTSYAGDSRVRMPRTLDLLPPQLARRLLSVATADEAQSLRGRRVAGRPATGLRIVPRHSATVIARIDLWLDNASGLPLEVAVTARGRRSPQVRTQFLDVRLSRPGGGVLEFSPPSGARYSFSRSPDLAASVDQQQVYALPDRLGGLARSRGPSALAGSGAVQTYGDGYALLAVLPLPSWVAARTVWSLATARRLDVPGAAAVVVPLDLASCVVVAASDHGWLLVGTVSVGVVERAARELAAQPPAVVS